VKNSHVRMASLGLIGLLVTVSGGTVRGDGPQPKPTPAAAAPVPAPAMPADLARRVLEITDAVLEHHIDPPARQQMILSGIKSLDRAAGAPDPIGLSRRVSTIATLEQLAALLNEVWPKTTAKPLSATKLEDVLLEGLVAAVPGQASVMTDKERNALEQFAGNRYVGIHIALGTDDKEKRPMMFDVFQGGPADRAGVKKGDLLEEVDGVDTKGKDLRDVVERLRGDEGTVVTIKVRQPKETKSRTMTLTRGKLPHATIEGITRNQASGDWKVRLDVPEPIGYIKVTDIGASTPHELRKLARQMEDEGLRALVIDLRGSRSANSTMHPAMLLADCFLDGGPIGRVRTVRGETTYQADSDALFRGWPIAVLVDRSTAGTAEWLAAALQDNHRAVVVGSPTQGARQVLSAGAMPMGFASPRPYEATVTSSVPVGDGHLWVSMVTGILERGDGRPLSDPLETGLDRSASREKPDGGVQPDHVVPESGGPIPWAAQLQKARTSAKSYGVVDTPTKPAEKPDAAMDPALKSAVAVLHQALEKR
jgi:carboxyl-terminal processing protease